MIRFIKFLMLACLIAMLSTQVNAKEFDVKAFLDNVHVRVGVAHKIQETRLSFGGVPMRKALTARLGFWYRFNNVTDNCYVDIGIDHHSQYTENAPFNKREEYHKTELFLDGICTLGGLL